MSKGKILVFSKIVFFQIKSNKNTNNIFVWTWLSTTFGAYKMKNHLNGNGNLMHNIWKSDGLNHETGPSDQHANTLLLRSTATIIIFINSSSNKSQSQQQQILFESIWSKQFRAIFHCNIFWFFLIFFLQLKRLKLINFALYNLLWVSTPWLAH